MVAEMTDVEALVAVVYHDTLEAPITIPGNKGVRLFLTLEWLGLNPNVKVMESGGI